MDKDIGKAQGIYLKSTYRLTMKDPIMLAEPNINIINNNNVKVKLQMAKLEDEW